MKNNTKTNSKEIISNNKLDGLSNKRIDVLYKNIVIHIQTARNNVRRSVNSEQVKACWLIGRDIIEEEQVGKERSNYGVFLLEELSIRLTKEFGSGFGRSTLADIRKFYLVYQKVHAVRGQLTRIFHQVLYSFNK